MMPIRPTIKVIRRPTDDEVSGLFASESDEHAPAAETAAVEVRVTCDVPAVEPVDIVEVPTIVAPVPVLRDAVVAAASLAAAATPLAAALSATPARAIQTVTVHDVLTRKVPIAWFEAVAIIAEASTVAVAAGSETPFPDASGILLTSEGAVLLQAGRSSEAPVAAVSRTLHALLSDASGAPAGLRLLATAAADAYPTLGDFAGAIAYFARPDRRELIRAVFERCSAAPASPEGETQRETKRRAETSPRRSSKMPSWLPIAVGVVCVIGALTGVWAFWPAGARDTRAVAAGVTRTQDLAKTVAAKINSTLGLDEAEPPAAAPAASKPRRARPASQRRASPRRIPQRSASASSSVPAPELPVPTRTAVLPPTPAAPAAPDPERAIMIAPTETAIVRATTEKVVYSRDDEDVRPPVMTYPQLPASALPESVSPIVNTLELLIGEDGSVERVRMLSRPRRMSDMMILSGIKMWRFRPASKAGQPVKYRTVLNWTVTP